VYINKLEGCPKRRGCDDGVGGNEATVADETRGTNGANGKGSRE
jgi:hypothetical protein